MLKVFEKVSLVLALLLLCAALAVAGGQTEKETAGAQKEKGVTITVVGAATEYLPAVQIYNKLYPNVKVEVIDVNWGNGGKDTKQKELTLMASGAKLDVLKMIWGKEFFRNGVIMDLTDEVKSWPIYKDYTSGQLERMTYDGRIYAPTWTNATILMFYNKDILDRISAQPPKTMDEMVTIAKAIKAANLKTASGQPVFCTNMEGGNWVTGHWVWAMGVDLMTPDFKQTLIDSPKAIAAYTWLQDFIKNGWAPKVDGTGNAAFLNGQIALMPDGQWDYDAISKAGFNWGVEVMPAGPAGDTVSIGGIEFGIPMNSQHKTEALNFIKVLLSRDYALATGNVTDPKDYSDPQVQAAWKKFPGKYDMWMVQEQALKNSKYNFLEAPFWYSDASTVYNNALQQILSQMADPSTVMKATAQTINQGIAAAVASDSK